MFALWKFLFYRGGDGPCCHPDDHWTVFWLNYSSTHFLSPSLSVYCIIYQTHSNNSELVLSNTEHTTLKKLKGMRSMTFFSHIKFLTDSSCIYIRAIIRSIFHWNTLRIFTPSNVACTTATTSSHATCTWKLDGKYSPSIPRFWKFKSITVTRTPFQMIWKLSLTERRLLKEMFRLLQMPPCQEPPPSNLSPSQFKGDVTFDPLAGQ